MPANVSYFSIDGKINIRHFESIAEAAIVSKTLNNLLCYFAIIFEFNGNGKKEKVVK